MSFQRKPPKDGLSKGGGFAKKPPQNYGSSFRPKSRSPREGDAEDGDGQESVSAADPPKYPTHKSGGLPNKKAGRDVDERKARKVLRALENARAEALANGADLSVWENEFMGSLETRIDTYGSAFRDPHKGALEEPISNLQRVKLKEIHAKATGKAKKPGFGQKRPLKVKADAGDPKHDKD